MERVSNITHLGKKILYLNFANCKQPQEILSAIENAKKEVVRNPPKSLLTLTDVSDSLFPKELVDAMRDLAAHNKPYVKAAALVGITGMKKYILNTVIKLTGRKLEAFDNQDIAKSWLVNQK